MSTVKQLNDQIAKLQDQKDQLTARVDPINKTIAQLHDQMANANDTQKLSIQQRLASLQAQKSSITGEVATEATITEDGEGGVDVGASVSSDSYMSTAFQAPVFAYTKKKKPKILTRKQFGTVTNYLKGK